MKTFKIAAAMILLAVSITSCESAGENTRKRQRENETRIRQEISYGRTIAIRIIREFGVVEDKKATYYLNQVGKSIALYAGRDDFEYHFAILDSDTVNAYAAPGGYIFVTRGAIALMENEAELAGVLAHEIAHVNLKHILKELPPPRDTEGFVDRASAILSAQGTLVTTAMDQISEQAMQLLLKKGFKVEDELMADRTAAEYLAATGYGPRPFVNYLQILEKRFGDKNQKAYNTHPSFNLRIESLNKYIAINHFNENRPLARKRFIANMGKFKTGGPA